MFIKICGITTVEQIDAAADLGYSAAGIVLHKNSPRCCTPGKAAALAEYAAGRIVTVAVALKYEEIAEAEKAFDLIQLYEFLDDERLIFSGDTPPPEGRLYRYFMHDTSRGSGKTEVFPSYPDKIKKRLILSGGLNCDNVVTVVKNFSPAGVDVSSGVEKIRGVKDIKLMERFIREVNNAYK